jgi:hypothetical protein
MLFVTSHPDAEAVLEKAYLLNPFDVWVVLLRASQLVFAGRFVDGTTLMETALIQGRERYDTNYLAALFNTFITRIDVAEAHLAKARELVGEDYPSLKVIDLVIAQSRGDELRANALKTEVLEIAKHTRVGVLTSGVIDWNETELKQVTDIVLKQRLSEASDWIINKPRHISDSDWSRFQVTMRLAEVDITPSEAGGHLRRSEEEKAQLDSQTVSMSVDELSEYIGIYENQDGLQLVIERNGEQLVLISDTDGVQLLPMGDHHFEMAEIRMSIDFIIEKGNVTQLLSLFSQVTSVFKKKGDQQ